MEKIRAGVIGAGMGRHHIASYRNHPGVEVAALADIDETRLKQVGQEYGIQQLYTDPAEMVAREHLDVLSVATPNKFHKEQTLLGLEAGCHVLCEKPMAMNSAEAQEMINAARKADRRLMINFSYRFNPQSQALKKEVDRGTLGDIYFARTVWLRRRGLPGFGGWFGQKALSGGGPLIDLGVHRLDLALWLMGYPEPAYVMGSTYDFIGSQAARTEGKAFDVEDFAAGFVKFKNGASLEIEASWAGHIKEGELMHTRLLGTSGGMVQYNVNESYQFEAEVFTEYDGVRYNMTPAKPYPPCPGAMEHFAESIISDKPHIATGEEGLIVMELLDSIYESANTGRPVDVIAKAAAL